NVSVRPAGAAEYGTRTEMKNMNSFKAISRAIRSETRRQIELLEEGRRVVQETRRWDDNKEQSYAMRSKEDAHDYKYFPEPDIPPISISDDQIAQVRATLPELPDAKKRRYMEEFGLPEYDTGLLCSSVHLVRLFERTAELCNSPKDASNWIMVELMKLLNDSQTLPEDMAFSQDSLGRIINLLNGGKISRDSAKKVFRAVFEQDVDVDAYVEQNNMQLLTDNTAIKSAIEEVLANHEKSVREYKGGKEVAFNYLIGQSMKALRGKAPASEVTKILKELLG
ncbi:MAG: Asp-tRNA(Asn)/Glu-tRNA(Gln) amidotransferase GatCAB subunit B, partial [Clostridiales bacterium]|nr:Asp-tRNA(Asn)/Glu-tRNA(Gln) amidotransferase GatCAB subunit B [Clostridiales bacterium]